MFYSQKKATVANNWNRIRIVVKRLGKKKKRKKKTEKAKLYGFG